MNPDPDHPPPDLRNKRDRTNLAERIVVRRGESEECGKQTVATNETEGPEGLQLKRREKGS